MSHYEPRLGDTRTQHLIYILKSEKPEDSKEEGFKVAEKMWLYPQFDVGQERNPHQITARLFLQWAVKNNSRPVERVYTWGSWDVFAEKGYLWVKFWGDEYATFVDIKFPREWKENHNWEFRVRQFPHQQPWQQSEPILNK